MKYVLIKEGEYRPNLFTDFTETVNRDEGVEQVGFYSRMDPTMRLLINRSDLNPEMPLAVAHYHVDPSSTIQVPMRYRPIDMELMYKALETYDYVMFGLITPTHLVTDYKMLSSAIYMARNAQGKLVNVETGELINADSDTATFFTSYFGLVRAKGLPVYYLIMDPKLLHATDDFDYKHTASDTSFVLISDHDGTIKQNVFAPTFTGAQVFSNTLLTNRDEISLKLFTGIDSVLRNEDAGQLLNSADFTIDTDLPHALLDNTITIYPRQSDISIGYFNIKFNCGKFFDVAHELERPEFNYLIIRSK